MLREASMSTMTKRRLSLGCISIFLLYFTGSLSLAQRQQASTPAIEMSMEEQELLLHLTQQFDEALVFFNDPQRQSQSIDFLTDIIKVVEGERRSKEDIAEELVNMQQRALEHRARSFFNAGQLEGARDDFRQLILDNPRYTLDTDALSPRIVDFFEQQKKELVGYLAVTTEPAGARVTVNGLFVGITNFFPVEVHTGVARVAVMLEGYESYINEDYVIDPGEIKTLEVELVRNSARLPIFTQPADVEVILDGQFVGRTSGRLSREFRSFAPQGFDPDRVSAEFSLAALPIGRHEIELRLPCYDPARLTFDADAPQDYTARFVKLHESVGTLNVSSNPSNARVYLDGEFRGNTPVSLDRICSGEHRLEVKHITGKYVEDIFVGRSEALSVECPIRPTLAYLGLVAGQGVSERDRSDIDKRVIEELSKLEAMNFVVPKRSVLETVLGSRGLDFLVDSDGKASAPETVRDVSERLGSELEVEALLIAYVPVQRLTKDVVFNFLAVGSTRPDHYTMNYLRRDALPELVRELSTPTPLFGSWLGVTTVDTRLKDGPIILSLDPEAPAAAAKLKIGDILIEVEGVPSRWTKDLLNAVKEHEPEDKLKLKIMRGDTVSSFTVTVGQTPIEIPLNDPTFLYNKAILDLRHLIIVDPVMEPLARLNLSLCHMQLGDYETALKEHLPQVTMKATSGISQGTVLYRTAIAYLKLGEREEASRMFEEALAFEAATLQSNSGPRVVPLAQRHLRELKH